MEWLSYTIKTETEAEEAVSAMLGELGLESLEIIEADPLSAEDKALLFLAPDAELQRRFLHHPRQTVFSGGDPGDRSCRRGRAGETESHGDRKES